MDTWVKVSLKIDRILWVGLIPFSLVYTIIHGFVQGRLKQFGGPVVILKKIELNWREKKINAGIQIHNKLMLVKLEESWAEIHNKLGPKLKIPLMLEKIKKNKHKNVLGGNWSHVIEHVYALPNRWTNRTNLT